ncbi:glycosyltransferase family 4 protein [Pseudomonas capsici]|uniref:glycosyltransferase family 4 protein n=1 Tax=Pseudomonas capsici TaxID=2810614 RepID=UPI0021F247C5|nr:glycosyltransferase family 4 protein [Pseudomonas capsici]MCV4281561.1 glycosyltransferase family 4 protein [Pseudomonas capsici]
MKLLIIHQNFPGQFRHIALEALKQAGIEVVAIGRDTAPGLQGIKIFRYKPTRPASEETHPYIRDYENAILHGQQVLRVAMSLKKAGYIPDVVLAHPGWGETLFIKEAFPAAKLIHFCEFFYHSSGADSGFDPEFPSSLDSIARTRVSNALHLLNLELCDIGITPTRWQHSLHPRAYQDKIRIVHEGIAVQDIKPDPLATLTLPNGEVLRVGDPVVTYVARNLEPYRGFHSFMRAVPHLLSINKKAKVVIVGGDGVSYGQMPKGFANWKERLLSEFEYDRERLIFTGKLPVESYRKLLQVSAVHVYLTYPFVLSWSLLEAMSAGCVVVGSKTPPVEEVISDGVNGFLVDFFDYEALAERVNYALEDVLETRKLKVEARKSAIGKSVKKGVDGYRELIGF